MLLLQGVAEAEEEGEDRLLQEQLENLALRLHHRRGTWSIFGETKVCLLKAEEVVGGGVERQVVASLPGPASVEDGSGGELGVKLAAAARQTAFVV